MAKTLNYFYAKDKELTKQMLKKFEKENLLFPTDATEMDDSD